MIKRKLACKFLVYIEIIFYMLPLSVTFMMGLEARLLPFFANAWETKDSVAGLLGIVSIVWWLLALRGLISLWKLCCKHQSYNLYTLPGTIKEGLFMGLIAILVLASPIQLAAIGFPLIYPLWVPLLLVVQLLIMLKYNVLVPQMTWQEQMQLILLTTDSSAQNKP